MPAQVLTNAYVSLAGNNISAYVRQVTINYEAETQDDTTMGDTTRSSIAGLKNWTLSIETLPEASSALDAILFPLVGSNGIDVEVRPVNATVSSTNPKYTAKGLVKSYTPVSGSVGDVLSSPVEVVPSKGAGSAALVRATS